MDIESLKRWLDPYGHAGMSRDPEGAAALHTDDATSQVTPFRGRKQNNESEHPPPIDELGVDTLSLRAPRGDAPNKLAVPIRNCRLALRSFKQSASPGNRSRRHRSSRHLRPNHGYDISIWGYPWMLIGESRIRFRQGGELGALPNQQLQ